MNSVIVSNQARCKLCGDTPWSGHQHDFVSCKCGAIAVDGGQAYLRRVGDPANIEEMSIVLDYDDVNSIINEVQESIDTGRNARGVAYAALRAIRDAGLLIYDHAN